MTAPARAVKFGEALPEGFEWAACGHCGGEAFRALLVSRDYLCGAPGEFQVVRCGRCGLARTNPRPKESEIGRYYVEGYEPHSRAVGPAAGTAIADQVPRARVLERFARKGRALDIGSGDGRFLLALRSRGWEVYGVEFVERMAELQRTAHGLDVKGGRIQDAGFEPGFFDAVTLWSVFEHIYQPMETLEAVRKTLRDDGVLLVAVPNFGSLEAKLFGEKWFSLSLPLHVYHYTPSTFKKLADRAGFRVEKSLFATTATATLQSLRYMKGMKASSAPEAIRAGAGSIPGEAARSGGPKRFAFQYGLVPALRLLDALKTGGSSIFILRKK